MHPITQFYLNAMGIQAWHLRHQPPLLHSYSLLRNNTAVGYLWVMQDSDNSQRWQEVEQLLRAIAAAMKLELVELSNESIATQTEKFILIMGLDTANSKLAKPYTELASVRGKKLNDKNFDLPIIITEHPFKLIQDPAQKRQVWQDLQLVLQLF